MKGIKQRDLKTVIDFLYHGEVNVLQENLNDFLATAEELQLKGLAGTSSHEQSETIEHKDVNTIHAQGQRKEKKVRSDNNDPYVHRHPENKGKIISRIDEGILAKSSVSFRDGNDELETKICSMIERMNKGT